MLCTLESFAVMSHALQQGEGIAFKASVIGLTCQGLAKPPWHRRARNGWPAIQLNTDPAIRNRITLLIGRRLADAIALEFLGCWVLDVLSRPA